MNGEKRYISYELNVIKTQKDWFLYYLTDIDHTEYKDFSEWWTDMMRMDLLVEVEE